MFRRLLLFGPILLLTLASCDRIPDPQDPPRLVNDFAGILTRAQADSLERALVEFDERSSNQICFVSVKSLHGMEVDDFGLKLANKWGIGTREHQNGVLLLIKPRLNREDYIDVTIQVGRGLEGAIPDVYASRIIRNVMGPYLKEDLYWRAVAKACDNLMGLASGEISKPRRENGLKQSFQRFKQGLPSKLKKGGRITLLALIGLGAIILFMWVNNKKDKGGNDKKLKDKNNDKTDSFVPPIIDPSSMDIGSSNDHSSDHGGGFGGFGGGGFGGGGASGRF